MNFVGDGLTKFVVDDFDRTDFDGESLSDSVCDFVELRSVDGLL